MPFSTFKQNNNGHNFTTFVQNETTKSNRDFEFLIQVFSILIDRIGYKFRRQRQQINVFSDNYILMECTKNATTATQLKITRFLTASCSNVRRY